MRYMRWSLTGIGISCLLLSAANVFLLDTTGTTSVGSIGKNVLQLCQVWLNSLKMMMTTSNDTTTTHWQGWKLLQFQQEPSPLPDTFSVVWHTLQDFAQQPSLSSSSIRIRNGNTTQSQRREKEDSSVPPPPPLPPLESIVDDNDNIVAAYNNVSWLLQFAIIGFPKTGTSALMHLLKRHPEVEMFAHERCDLGCNREAHLLRDLYRLAENATATMMTARRKDITTASSPATGDGPSTSSTSSQQPRRPPFRLGIKCPNDIENAQSSLENYRALFGKTRLVVGLRHPVLWFESLYNFRVQNGRTLPDPDSLIVRQGPCQRGMFNVCTFRSNFHLFLANLGKTDLFRGDRTTAAAQLRYIDNALYPFLHVVESPAKVFLYEVSQLRSSSSGSGVGDDDNDDDSKREKQFRLDLQRFLHLREPFTDRVGWFRPGRKYNRRNDTTSSTAATARRKLVPLQDEIERRKLDICQDGHSRVRRVLQATAADASRWIRRYFLPSPDVVVSDREHLESLLADWERDPCVYRKTAVGGSSSSTNTTTATAAKRARPSEPEPELVVREPQAGGNENDGDGVAAAGAE